MKSKFIIKVGQKHYGSGFHVNGRTRNNWPASFLSTDIDDARVFNDKGTAKAMATRLRNVLLEWIKQTKGASHYEWEPINVIEIVCTEGPVVDTKTSVLEELMEERNNK